MHSLYKSSTRDCKNNSQATGSDDINLQRYCFTMVICCLAVLVTVSVVDIYNLYSLDLCLMVIYYERGDSILRA